MTEQSQSPETQVALFRYGLIADLIHLPRGKGSRLYAKLREKAALDYTIPGTHRTRVEVETIRDWLGQYRRGGFDALKPKPRSDIGACRSIPQEVVDVLVSLKEEHPSYSVAMVIDEARRSGRVPSELALPMATVHRHLSRAGVMTQPAEEPTSKDRRHFAFEKAGELWMSDVMHGPAVSVDGRRKRKTYLIALIDDATRMIPFAAFALSENTSAFLPVLQQAVLRRGIPKRLYVDNGSAFRSHHLALCCAKLGITLIHARAYQPQGKGKQERWFRTVRMQLMPLLGEADLGSLDSLNRRLWAWVEGEYHQTPHRGLAGMTPFDAWASRSDEVRLPDDAATTRELFLFEQKRKVHKDRTLSLDGTLYEVDAALVGETVLVRFDPAKKGGPVDIWHKGKKVQAAKPVNAYANCFVKRNHDSRKLEPQSPAGAPSAGLSMRELSRGARGDKEVG
jgi:transposase InsO family protein